MSRTRLLVVALWLLPATVLAQVNSGPPRLRTLRPGDWYEYTSCAYLKLEGRELRLTETRRVRILDERRESPKGVSCLVMGIDTVTFGLGPPRTGRSEAYFVQDQDGSFVVHGRKRDGDENVQWIEEPSRGWVIDVKSPLQPGVSWSDDYRMSDGTTGSQTSTILREVGIEVPAGTFNTFRVHAQMSESDGMTVSAMDWYSPRLGVSVCTMAVVKTSEGATVVTSDVLKSYGLAGEGSAG